jgi:RimJ/RimL family protein N-acetyltransferase
MLDAVGPGRGRDGSPLGGDCPVASNCQRRLPEMPLRMCGRTSDLRLVELDDAEFILGLRLDPRLSRFLSRTSDSVEQQQQWLTAYKGRERQGLEYYFIVQCKQGQPSGTVRLYDFRGESFSWGSWIIRPGSPPWVSVESALLVYQCGFEKLGFAESHFEVRKENARVVAFHRRFGAKVVNENEQTFYFRFAKTDLPAARERYEKILI